MQSTLNELAVSEALLQDADLTKSKTKRATAFGLDGLVKTLSSMANTQIKDSEAQNKPLDPTTDRAKLVNAIDEKAKNLVS